MVELDLTSAKSKAAYEEIREWGQGKYGLHVTHLNIAKTKRECGIIERVNYQPSQEREQPIPETPKEKEEAKIEAFKHFRRV
ncbi:MAG: 23S rRNA methyltransferase [Clostridia bacterium]|nr:23S rRNA methyltransferase [Clostridia bacterium]